MGGGERDEAVMALLGASPPLSFEQQGAAWSRASLLEAEVLQGHVAEEIGHGLAVVSPADRLCQDHGDVNHLRRGREQRSMPSYQKKH